MPDAPNPRRDATQVERSGTVLESEEDIREALLSGLKGQRQGVPVEPAPTPQTAEGRTPLPFRPTVRPPVPLLTVFDDGKAEGEVIRLRDKRFLIGRTEGDLTFPLDGRVSARHVEITHQTVGGIHRWVLTDLQSTHGTFVRVSKTALADGAEILVGNGRYRFQGPSDGAAGVTSEHTPTGPLTSETQGWADEPGTVRPAALSELLGREIGNRLLLVKGEYWIGSDPACGVCRPDDPFCAARHVRLHRNARGGWHAEHNRTQNGLWLRMTQINVESVVHFQVGEQRFRLKV